MYPDEYNDPGYTRERRFHSYYRDVYDRDKAFEYLNTHWSKLPRTFFDWLRFAKRGDKYTLVEGVSSNELWSMNVD